MQNNIKNNEHDAFSESIRLKLEAHQMPVDPALWDTVAVGINASKAKRRFPFVWWITTGLAAAVALLLFVNIPVNQNESTIASTSKSSVVEKSNPSENLAQKNQNFASTTDNNVSKINPTISEQEKTDIIIKTIESESPNFKYEVSQKDIVAVNNTKVDIVIPTETNAVLTQVENKSTKETTTDTLISKPNSKPSEKLQLKKEDWTDPLKDKNNSNWELVAMVGSSGKTNSDIQTTPAIDFVPRESIVATQNSSAFIFAAEDFNDKTYLAPVSVGLSVARNVSPALSIESGITYTYLLTIFKNDTHDSKLHLHYIGLPLRFAYNFSTNNKWSIYAAVGGMIEKGLWSVYVQNQNNLNSIITTTVSDKINGWQFSLNSAIGGAYNIYKNTAIYFEPKLSYYFDNNQPISIRTENKLVIGFEGGLRYKF